VKPISGPDIAIVATQKLTLKDDGIAADVGQTLSVAPLYAAALCYHHKARFAKDTDGPPKRKRGRPKGSGSTYTRRDLTAETPEGTE
jgi:hypothetical protein